MDVLLDDVLGLILNYCVPDIIVLNWYCECMSCTAKHNLKYLYYTWALSRYNFMSVCKRFNNIIKPYILSRPYGIRRVPMVISPDLSSLHLKYFHQVGTEPLLRNNEILGKMSERIEK